MKGINRSLQSVGLITALIFPNCAHRERMEQQVKIGDEINAVLDAADDETRCTPLAEALMGVAAKHGITKPKGMISKCRVYLPGTELMTSSESVGNDDFIFSLEIPGPNCQDVLSGTRRVIEVQLVNLLVDIENEGGSLVLSREASCKFE